MPSISNFLTTRPMRENTVDGFIVKAKGILRKLEENRPGTDKKFDIIDDVVALHNDIILFMAKIKTNPKMDDLFNELAGAAVNLTRAKPNVHPEFPDTACNHIEKSIECLRSAKLISAYTKGIVFSDKSKILRS